MKKVFDWTIGSFFRTIGRIIAFLVVGGLIAYILADNDFRISELFFDNVKADTFNSKYMGPISGWNLDNSLGNQYSYANLVNGDVYDGYYTWTYFLNATGINKIQITGYFSNVKFDNSNFTCASYNSQGTCTSWHNYDGTNTLNFMLWLDHYDNPCTITWNDPPYTNSANTGYVWWTATCTYNATQLRDIYYHIEYTQDYNFGAGYATFGVNNNIQYWVSDSSVIIDNQNNNTQNIIQNQQNQTQQLLEDNTTQAESDSENFFGNFTVPDVGGLSAIVTAPLNTISSLLSSSCANLVLPLPYVDEDLTLPCMNDIYTEHFGLFFSLYQTIILAVVAYRCIRSIFFDIHGFTNPNDDRIEVIDL